MPMISSGEKRVTMPGRDDLQSLGVLVPVRFHPVRVFPGRHPLGRAGDGMRLLRTRPYVTREDNPRDIDKFSPIHDRQVVEREDEAQASITLLSDVSGSMATDLKAPLRNLCVIQLTYSLWRAGDRVGLALFDNDLRAQIRAANLKTQMQQTLRALQDAPSAVTTDVSLALTTFVRQDNHRHADLLFIISDFGSADEPSVPPRIDWREPINATRGNIVPVIISFELNDDIEGLVKICDAEQSARRLTRLGKRRIRAINAEERARVARLAAGFRAAGLDSIVVTRQRQVYPRLAQLARVRRGKRN